MTIKNYEPSETMYPDSFGPYVYTKHPKIWQAHKSDGWLIHFEADTAEEAYHRARVIFNGENFEYRRLPIITIKKENTQNG